MGKLPENFFPHQINNRTSEQIPGFFCVNSVRVVGVNARFQSHEICASTLAQKHVMMMLLKKGYIEG